MQNRCIFFLEQAGELHIINIKREQMYILAVVTDIVSGYSSRYAYLLSNSCEFSLGLLLHTAHADPLLHD
jgi:hypothetical protein